MGSGSVAAAARVEPSPEGLAQADTAVRVDPLDTNSFMRRLPARSECVLPIGRKIRVALSRLLAVATKSPICQTLAIASFESEADLHRMLLR